MASAQQLNRTTAMTPAQIERNKTREEKAQDIAYTINHALSCGTTDIFIQPWAGAWIEGRAKSGNLPKWINWVRNLFEKHDHAHGDHSNCAHEPQAPIPPGNVTFSNATFTPTGAKPVGFGVLNPSKSAAPAAATPHKPTLLHNAKHWLRAEVYGDVGAIPLTIAVQRFFPGVMHGLRRVLEPMFKGAFQRGAERDARRWAHHHGLDTNAPEVQAKAQMLYEHEMSHLPKAVVWNMFSVPINIVGQMLERKSRKMTDLFDIALGKTFGIIVSNTMLIGGRALAPDAFHKWDSLNSKYLIMPVSKAVGRIAGVDDKTMEEAAQSGHHAVQSAPEVPATKVTQPRTAERERISESAAQAAHVG